MITVISPLTYYVSAYSLFDSKEEARSVGKEEDNEEKNLCHTIKVRIESTPHSENFTVQLSSCRETHIL